jgi:hypothetical protein
MDLRTCGHQDIKSYVAAAKLTFPNNYGVPTSVTEKGRKEQAPSLVFCK